MSIQVKSAEFGWNMCQIKLLGHTIKGITAWSLKKEVEKEALYGAGGDAIDIGVGNTKCSGKITIYGYELDAMNTAAQAAGYADITELPHDALVLTAMGAKTATSSKTVWTAIGLAFSEIEHAMKQDDKSRSYELPFICMSINSFKL